jgi:hypothetical protein
MLRNIGEILNYHLFARDGEIGKCKDFLFDDDQWTIRYMVADTRKWLPGRKVLISPLSLGSPQWAEALLPVDLDKNEIKESPPLDEDAPVSRQYERQWFDYYRFPYYWPQDSLWGINHYLNAKKKIKKEKIEDPVESHLRSVREVTGYAILAIDGKIGHVEDFIVDDTTWTIRYLVIDTRDWLPGRKVLISPLWVDSIYWPGKKINVTKNKETIEKSPEYHPNQPVNLAYETRLYDYYGRPVA